MSDATEPRRCRLHGALGRAEACPEAACPFWDPRADADGGCAVGEVDLVGRPDLAEWLLRIRSELETAASRDDEDRARTGLYRLLETGDADGG